MVKELSIRTALAIANVSVALGHSQTLEQWPQLREMLEPLCQLWPLTPQHSPLLVLHKPGLQGPASLAVLVVLLLDLHLRLRVPRYNNRLPPQQVRNQPRLHKGSQLPPPLLERRHLKHQASCCQYQVPSQPQPRQRNLNKQIPSISAPSPSKAV